MRRFLISNRATSKRGLENTGAPRNSDLIFDVPSFFITTDAGNDVVLFQAQINNAASFAARGYTFSGWTINTVASDFDNVEIGTTTASTANIQTNNMVIGDAGLRTIHVAVNYSGPANGTIVASITGSVEAPPGAIVTLFTATNYGASASPAIFSFGQAFVRGDIPTASTIQVRRQDTNEQCVAVLDGPVSWDDGSLKFAQVHVIDSTADISAGATRVYEITGVTGSRTPAASGFDPWSWISANTNLVVETTNQQGWNLAALTPSTRPMALNTAILTTTRRRRFTDAARVQTLYAWAPAAAPGLPNDIDGHLVGEHFIDLYRDAIGNVLGGFYACVVDQSRLEADPLSSGEAKQKRWYNAVLKNGATTLSEYSKNGTPGGLVEHPANSAWVTVQRTGLSRGRRWWIAGTETREPTIRVEQNRGYLRQAWATLPYEPITVNSSMGFIGRAFTGTPFAYNPGSGFGWKVAIDAAGGDNGRGHITRYCTYRLNSEGDQAIYNDWLVAAYACLHVPQYRVRNGEAAASIGDATHMPIPFELQIAATSRSTGFTTGEFSGLGVRRSYNKNNNSNGTLRTLRTYATPLGSSTADRFGIWTPGADNSHAINWAGVPALLTGDRIFRDAAIDHAVRTVWAASGAGSSMGIEPFETFNGWQNEGFAVRYYSPAWTNSQVRSEGWGMNLLAAGINVAPDGDPRRALLLEILSVQEAMHKARVDWIEGNANGANQNARRLLWPFSNPTYQQWMESFGVAAYVWASRSFPDRADLKAVADFLAARRIKQAASLTPLICGTWLQRCILQTGTPRFAPPARPIDTVDRWVLMVAVDATDQTILNALNLDTPTSRQYRNWCWPALNDVVRVGPVDFGSSANLVQPPEFDQLTDYYITEMVSDTSFRIAATPGGTPITMTRNPSGSGSAQIGTFFGLFIAAPQRYVNETNIMASTIRHEFNWDDYWPIGALWSAPAALWQDTTKATAGEKSTAATNIAAMRTAIQAKLETDMGVDLNFTSQWILARP